MATTTTQVKKATTGWYDVTLRATGNRIATIQADYYGGGQFGRGRGRIESWTLRNNQGKELATGSFTRVKAIVEAAAAAKWAA